MKNSCKHEAGFLNGKCLVCGEKHHGFALYEACSCGVEEKIHPYNVHLCEVEVVPPIVATAWDIVPGWVRFQNSLKAS
jgi:hypothetical protein